MISTYSGCDGVAEVILVAMEELAHVWPEEWMGLGYDANVSIIEFFLSHQK